MYLLTAVLGRTYGPDGEGGGVVSTPYLIAIAAMSRNRVIGKGGHIPWTCKEDMEWFKRTTMGHPVIMGRKTWESLDSIPGRSPLILSKTYVAEFFPQHEGNAVAESGIVISSSTDHLEWGLAHLSRYSSKSIAYVIGGAQTYTVLMPWTREILLTVIDIEVDGDTHFPEISDEFELKSTTPLSERAVVHHYVRR